MGPLGAAHNLTLHADFQDIACACLPLFDSLRSENDCPAQVLQGKFGAATNAINGALECHGKNMQQARDRFDIYRKVLPALGVKEAPHETGCYN